MLRRVQFETGETLWQTVTGIVTDHRLKGLLQQQCLGIPVRCELPGALVKCCGNSFQHLFPLAPCSYQFRHLFSL